MAVIGTFGSYGTAILAIHAAQAHMNVTGNNVGNINTEGYTRQRGDQCSMYSTGAPRYQNSYNLNIGYGAMVHNVSQLRDPYLDIRFRNENSSLGYYEAMQDGMNQLAHILDEVGMGKEEFGTINAQLGEFKNALRDLTQYPGSTQHDDLVNAAASTLCSLLNSAAKELQEVKDNQEAKLKESITDVNNILNQIRDLNEQIRTQSIYGGNALELRDARNMAIDKLSKYMKLNVTYSMEKLNDGTEIEKLSISLKDTTDPYTGKPYALIDGIYGTQFLMPESTPQVNPKYREDLPTSMIYWNDQAKVPTHDIREARRWNNTGDTAYRSDAKPYLDGDTETDLPFKPIPVLDENGQPVKNPDGTTQVTKGAANTPNPAYYRYIVAADYQSVDDPDVVQINGQWYTNNQNKAEILYNEAGNAAAAAYQAANGGTTLFDPNAITSYKYLATEPEGKDTINSTRGTPDYDVLKAVASTDNGNIDTYYTNLWNLNPTAGSPSYAIPMDNFKDGANDNLYLFSIDALKDQRGLVYQEGTDLESVVADLGDNDIFGAIQAMRELLTEEAEYSSAEDVARDPNATIKRGIPFYQHMLDSFAQTVAKMFNDANQIGADPTQKSHLGAVYEMNGDNFVTADGGTVKLPDGTDLEYTKMTELYNKISNPKGSSAPAGGGDPAPNYENFPADEDSYAQYEQDIQTYQSYVDALRDQGKLNEVFDFYKGGVLFSNNGNSDDPTGINAMNISVSHAWSEGAVRVLKTKDPDQTYIDPDTGEEKKANSETLNDNLAHMMSFIDQKLNYYANDTVRDALPNGGKEYFTGSFQEMFRRSGALLGADTAEVNAKESFFSITTLSLDNDRLSVSGVDLNEEATNMMKYSQSFSAACQLLTAIDEMLDKLINGTI